MECNQPRNVQNCACTNIKCAIRGVCCDCLAAHLAKKSLPACCFPPEADKTLGKSFAAFAKAWQL